MLGGKVVQVLMVVAAFALTAGAQEQAQKTIQHVPMKPTSPASGKEMYTQYCAVCHGTEGKGNGPAADALKTPPSDLTVLSKNNGGSYPSAKVASAIRGDAAVAAHGSKEMPIWGKLFRTVSGGQQSEVEQRIANLVSYIKTLQVSIIRAKDVKVGGTLCFAFVIERSKDPRRSQPKEES